MKQILFPNRVAGCTNFWTPNYQLDTLMLHLNTEKGLSPVAKLHELVEGLICFLLVCGSGTKVEEQKRPTYVCLNWHCCFQCFIEWTKELSATARVDWKHILAVQGYQRL
jgi:hypothetical protein